MPYGPCTGPLNWKRGSKIQVWGAAWQPPKLIDESPGRSSLLDGDYLNDLGDMLLYYPFYTVL